MNRQIVAAASLLILILVESITGCSSTKVSRIPVEKSVDLSGLWNDTDARTVSKEMIKDCLEGKWLGEFNKKFGKDPVVIVGPVVNRSHEHINTAVFIKSLERNLLNSGKVVFVAASDERLPVREERQDQHALPRTRQGIRQACGQRR